MSDGKGVGKLGNVLRTGLVALGLLGALGGYGWYRFGTVGALAAVLSGRAAYLEPARVSLGDLQPGQRISVPVRLHNLTSGRLKVLGSNSTCSCIEPVKGLPCELAPGEGREFDLCLALSSAEARDVEILVTFYVNAEGERLQTVLSGRILPVVAGSGSPPPKGWRGS